MNIDDSKKSRATLKSYFVKNSIPTEGQFAQVMDGFLNQRDDGLVKMPGDPLSIEAAGDDASFKKTLNLYTKFSDPSPSWTVALRPRGNPADSGTGRSGLSFNDSGDRSRLCIDAATGNVGVGVVAPAESLEVAGRVKTGSLTVGPWPPDANYIFFGTSTLNQTQAANYALLQQTGGTESGRTFLNSPIDIRFRIKNVDQMALDANGRLGIGTTVPQARLQVVGGAIMPSAGNDENSGILFPRDAGGGTGDRAWMRYYSRGGESMTLELGISDDADDQIALTAPGGVTVGMNDTSSYRMRLASRPNGYTRNTLHISADSNIRGSDSITHLKFGKDGDYQFVHKGTGSLGRNTLALHCDTADALGFYSSGMTPLLEVEGGTGNTYIRGNCTVAGNVGIGTNTPRAKLEVMGGAIMPSAGSDENSGILFPRDAGGGTGDRAWMRYYSRGGEAMTLELGISDDADDQIALTAPGGVAVGINDTSSYRMRLASRSNGSYRNTLHISADSNIRGSDSITHLKFGKDGDYQFVHKGSGYLKRNTLALHCDTADALGCYSSGFTPLFEVEGGTGNVYHRGDITMEGSRSLKSTGRMHITGEELLFLLHKQGVIIGREWGGTGNLVVDGTVGIGTRSPRASLEVFGGAIMPSWGNSESAGILFPPDPAGGGSDRAWIRYYPRSGESMSFEIGTSNDADDHIVLRPSGQIQFNPGNSNDPKSYINANGDYVKSSSERFKDNITPLSTVEALSILESLEPVGYVFKADESKRRNLGFIAERTHELFTSPDGKMLAVDGIIALLTRVVKDQQVAIQKLEAELHTQH